MFSLTLSLFFYIYLMTLSSFLISLSFSLTGFPSLFLQSCLTLVLFTPLPLSLLSSPLSCSFSLSFHLFLYFSFPLLLYLSVPVFLISPFHFLASCLPLSLFLHSSSLFTSLFSLYSLSLCTFSLSPFL